jgi:hypothetical protein
MPPKGDIFTRSYGLRAGASATSASPVTINALLASTGSGLDQSTTSSSATQSNYICHGCLNNSRSVIFLAVTVRGGLWVIKKDDTSA